MKAARITSRTLMVAFVGLMFAVVPAVSQEARPRAGGNWSAPHTPDGQPDMQGSYSHVGLGTGKEERPAALCPQGGCYDANWFQEPKGKLMLTLPMDLVDLPDGKLPLQPWAAARKEEYKENQADPRRLEHVDTQARCLHSGVPRSNWAIVYVGYQIIQGPGYVAMYTEYNHEFRFIPLDGRPHINPAIRLFGGDSVGRWEGNTLIVETTNIAVPPSTGFGMLDMQGTPFSDAIRLVERYTIMDPDTIAVEVTVDDPKVYTKPWKTAGAFVRGLKDYQVYEYACHEGNLGMQHLSYRIPKKK